MSMKSIIISLVLAALVCGYTCNTAFGQSPGKPFGTTKVSVVELKVTGMTCQGCADHVTSALAGKTGIIKSDVKFIDNSASITYDPANVNEFEIIRAIEETGYQVEVKLDGNKNISKRESGIPHACCVPKKKT